MAVLNTAHVSPTPLEVSQQVPPHPRQNQLNGPNGLNCLKINEGGRNLKHLQVRPSAAAAAGVVVSIDAVITIAVAAVATVAAALASAAEGLSAAAVGSAPASNPPAACPSSKPGAPCPGGGGPASRLRSCGLAAPAARPRLRARAR